MEHPPLDVPAAPRLAENIGHFARALRAAGMKVGPGQVADGARAVAAGGFTDRTDFYWMLHAVLVRRPEDRAVFAQVFRLYWRDPRYLEHMMSYMIPAIRGTAEEREAQAAEKRAAEGLLDGVDRDAPEIPQEEGEEIEIQAAATASGEERLRTLDFEQMGAAEIAEVKRMIARLRLPVRPLPSRRDRAAHRGRADPRATLRAMARTGGLAPLSRKRPATCWPDLVALCDISGSMSAYSRMMLHFLHAVAAQPGPTWHHVHAFTFGTRLTNVTRHLRHRDVDAALAAAGSEAQDWEGGTRIGESLAAFNRGWGRRVLSRGAAVLIVTDGLERGDPDRLEAEMERLSLTARRVIWLNPLLRWDGFAPRAAGIRAMLPHVARLVPGHSVQSLARLGAVLSSDDGGNPP
ncbi:MAG: vWA domain-containing protein [Hasllibacter sp.]